MLALHLANLGIIAWFGRASLQAALDMILFVIAVVAGRVVPMFTNNGVPGAGAARNPAIERVALGSVLALVVADVVGAPPAVLAVIALAATIVHGARLSLWRPWRTLKKPIVWVLHAGYAWIVVYLLLRGLAESGIVSAVFATHALTIGGIGGMTIGMMTRTARGHTGRMLDTDAFENTAYALVSIAAAIRVFGGMLAPGGYMASVVVSGLCWSAAFAIYAVRYWPILSSPRPDGKPG